MKISIIVPVYNLEDYIVGTLNSIDRQIYTDYECIIVNDGSTDQSEKVIRAYIAGKSKFKLITTENQGVSAARNEGLTHITGDAIYFIDGDDLIPHDALALLVAAAVEHEADIVIGKMVHQRGGSLHEISTYQRYGVNTEGFKTLEENPEILHSIGPTAKLFSRKVIGDYKFPTGRKFAEEHGFVVNAYLKSDKIYGISQLVYNYVVRDKGDASATQTLDANVEEYMTNLIDTHQEVYDLMKGNVSLKVMQYYYFRITEFIMWPLLMTALKNSTKLPNVNAVLINYFKKDYHKEMQTIAQFINVYVRNYVRYMDYDTFNKQSKYMDYMKRNRKEYPLLERCFFGGKGRGTFELYKVLLKIRNTSLRVYRRLIK